MISRSNIVDGSKPYIVEDRPMISRSSGDRGESPLFERERIDFVGNAINIRDRRLVGRERGRVVNGHSLSNTVQWA